LRELGTMPVQKSFKNRGKNSVSQPTGHDPAAAGHERFPTGGRNFYSKNGIYQIIALIKENLSSIMKAHESV